MISRPTKINDLASLGEYILSWSPELADITNRACADNPWFTTDTVHQSLKAIAEKFLNKASLEKLLNQYEDNGNESKTVALILAGNIPLVGFHDVLSVFLSGHRCIIKLSDKDKLLLPFLIDKLIEVNKDYQALFTFAERLKNFDAVIATGSNTSGNYFEKYFSQVPNIIRKNRNAVAILYNDITEDNLRLLGEDVFAYFGLGCRNVSKLYLEEGFDLKRIFQAILPYSEVSNHNKYMNNYDYNNALNLLNKQSFLTNDFLILKEENAISSRIASLHFEYFSDINNLARDLNSKSDLIQCVVSDRDIEGLSIIPIGKAQCPELMDYADNVDTMKFLISL